jgi:hypothetical protein
MAFARVIRFTLIMIMSVWIMLIGFAMVWI